MGKHGYVTWGHDIDIVDDSSVGDEIQEATIAFDLPDDVILEDFINGSGFENEIFSQ